MSKPVLHGLEMSAPCRLVLASAKIVGLDLEFKNVDLFSNEHKSEAYLKVHVYLIEAEQNVFLRRVKSIVYHRPNLDQPCRYHTHSGWQWTSPLGKVRSWTVCEENLSGGGGERGGK